MRPYARPVLLTNRPTSPPPSGAACRWLGELDEAVLSEQRRRGRQRQWVYAAAADADVVVGAAVVDIGLGGLGTCFAFCVTSDRQWLWEPGLVRSVAVDGVAGEAHHERRGAAVHITPAQLQIDVPGDGGLQATIDLARGTPTSLLTPTPDGGWNATTKTAGQVAAGSVVRDGVARDLEGGAWTDATRGRQDRHTTWRWAAGAGRAHDGRRVGIQASTGMNALGPGEDLVWWNDVASPLPVSHLAPVAEPDGAWGLAGSGWSLHLEPWGLRAASEGFGPMRSRYHQPVGTWSGTLPDPSGVPTPVTLRGVAEDHEARW